jgi:hypothetical protein
MNAPPYIANALMTLGLVRKTPAAPGPVDDIIRLLKVEVPVPQLALRDIRLPPGKRRTRRKEQSPAGKYPAPLR